MATRRLSSTAGIEDLVTLVYDLVDVVNGTKAGPVVPASTREALLTAWREYLELTGAPAEVLNRPSSEASKPRG